jgi:uncharacterized membrane protein
VPISDPRRRTWYRTILYLTVGLLAFFAGSILESWGWWGLVTVLVVAAIAVAVEYHTRADGGPR